MKSFRSSSLLINLIILLSPGFFGGCSKPLMLMQRDRDARFSRSDFVSSENTGNVEPETKRLYKNNSRVTREDFIDKSQEEGSLWASSGQTNYYFTKNRTRNAGDIITLIIDNDLYRDIGMEVRDTLSPPEKIHELEKTREKYRQKFASGQDPKKEAQATDAQVQKNAAPPLVPELPFPKNEEEGEKLLSEISMTNVDIYSSLRYKSGDKMMGEILERYPNGNYKIKSTKRIAYERGAPRLVNIVGVVKASDIEEETDSVNSGKLYEYRVEVSH